MDKETPLDVFEIGIIKCLMIYLFNKQNWLTDKENIDPKQRTTHRQQTNATNDISTVADILEHFEEAAGTENLPLNNEKSAVSELAPKCCESADTDSDGKGSDSDMSDESDLNLDNTTGNYSISIVDV